VFIDIAYAQGAQPGGGAGGFIFQLFPLLIIMVIFYFLLIRPQQKQRRDMQEMLNNLKEGDRIVTRGGLMGMIDKVEPDRGTLRIEIGNGIKVRVRRDYVDQVVKN
jgi:preprotein translocase subunit YajC